MVSKIDFGLDVSVFIFSKACCGSHSAEQFGIIFALLALLESSFTHFFVRTRPM